MATAAPALARGRPLVLGRGAAVAGILVAWVVLWLLLRGQDNLFLGQVQLTPLHRELNGFADTLLFAQQDNPVFTYLLNPVRDGIDWLVQSFQYLISVPAPGRPVPEIGWLGVVAIATAASYLFGNLRVAVLACLGFLSFGLLGYWQASMDTLVITLASVLIALLVGIPLGVWAGLSNRANAVFTPVLDFMQTMPSFVYLAPLAIVFLIGPASATIATVIYAMPPVIRITAYGIRSVSKSAVEAAESLGSTRTQALVKVLLPMARRTIVVGVNQTTMAALSMATVVALIDGPGLGAIIIDALESVDVGTSFVSGLAIVIMAIVLDRVTTAASVRTEQRYRAGGNTSPARRRIVVGVVLAAVAVLVYLSRTYVWAANFPALPGLDLGGRIAALTETVTGWVVSNFTFFTVGLKNTVTYGLLNPLESLLADSPWYVTGAAILALAAVIGRWRGALAAAVCLALIYASGLWYDAMVTLAMTLVATVVVMVLGVVLGVWMGRSDRVDAAVRPVLDAAQVMPPFVYLVPFLALFEASRFTAIFAAVVYAAPVAIKLVSDGIRAVEPNSVEAAQSAGSSTWQVIAKVQLPMSRRALTVAANQGLIYVLAMVVVGGLVGAQALGYDVVAGFAQLELQGKGLAAGLAIVLLGIMLDRVTKEASREDRKAGMERLTKRFASYRSAGTFGPT